jgi:hypothetical protein
MTSDMLRDTIALLTEQIHARSDYRLDNVSFDSGRYPHWADAALGRVALLVGPVEGIRYSAGVLDQSDDMKVLSIRVIVITDKVIVEGKFSSERDYLRPEGTVTAWQRGRLERVEVGAVSLPDPTQRSPEGQRGSAEATLVMLGGVEIALPPKRALRQAWDPELLEFLPQLLDS